MGNKTDRGAVDGGENAALEAPEQSDRTVVGPRPPLLDCAAEF